MSSTTGKKATKASPAKTQKRSTRKKTAGAAPRKTRRSSMVTKKKAVKKKSAVKKMVPKKKSARKISKKAASTQREKARSRKQASTAPETEATGDTRSLSWMSARAASALKAVKASQAEKGQTLLAKTRKQATEILVDDERLIEIADGMPVDNEGLLEYSTEQSLDGYIPQTDNGIPAPGSDTEETHAAADAIADEINETEPLVTLNEGASASSTTDRESTQPPPGPAAAPPPPSSRQATLFRPALATGIILATLVLGYYFWAEGDNSAVDNTKAAVEQVDTADVSPVAATEPKPDEPRATVTHDVVSPAEKPAREPVKNGTDWHPAELTGTWEPVYSPQATTVPPAVATKPAQAEPRPTVTEPIPPAVQPPVPAPVQRGYRAPPYGAYPQQRQPAYPQYYYR